MGKISKIGWILGVLSGTALGMLFAPRKGKELRDKIQKNLKDGDIKSGGQELLKDVKIMGGEVFDAAKDIYNSKDVQGALKKAKHKAKKVYEENIKKEL